MAAFSHVKSKVIPLFINPSQEDLWSLYVTMAYLSACQNLENNQEKGLRRQIELSQPESPDDKQWHSLRRCHCN